MADIKFELNRLANYSDDAIIQEIQRVAAKLNISPLTIKAFDKESKVKNAAIRRRFDSWEKALKAAGLGHLYASRIVRGTARRLYNNEILFENLYEVWQHYGRQPHDSEMNRVPSKIKTKTYKNYFGTWRKALLAFVEFMNQNSGEPKAAPTREGKETLPHEKKTPAKDEKRPEKQRPENRREISLGLRFKVMYRDHFKCVLCGDNPPTSPGLKLHIDHIVPWSKEGKTEIDNLRTLCEACNLGRGNRYID